MDEKDSYQIFLSYTRKDKVESLYNKLVEAGYKPWMDTKDILPGEKWEISLKGAIKNSAFFLACLSGNSVSKRGYVQKEIRYALDALDEMLDEDICLIPVRLEECEVHEKVNYYRLKAVALESGCKPAKDRRRYESPHRGVLYLGARYIA